MPVLILASRRDIAAQNIAHELLHLKKFEPVSGTSEGLFRHGEVYLKHVDTDGIYTENLDVDFDVDVAIFASRHRSESGSPTLTAHWPGNLTSKAEFGGKPKSLSITDPPRLRAALLALDRECAARKLKYVTSLEATHHGPTELNVPTLFVEIGSSEEEWRDTQAAAAVAEAIWETAIEPPQGQSAVGFGGGHYCNKQSQAIRTSGYAFGHIFSKYFFEEYDENIVHMAFNRTKGKCRTAVIDWKGIRCPERARLIQTLNEMQVEIVRV